MKKIVIKAEKNNVLVLKPRLFYSWTDTLDMAYLSRYSPWLKMVFQRI